jgi:uncharacterized membrane protein YfcA
MVADGSRLAGVDAAVAVFPMLLVSTTAAAAAPTGGFVLWHGAEATAPLPAGDASAGAAAAIRAALEALPSVSAVIVVAAPALAPLPGWAWATQSSATLRFTDDVAALLGAGAGASGAAWAPAAPGASLTVGGAAYGVASVSVDGSKLVNLSAPFAGRGDGAQPAFAGGGGADVSVYLVAFSGAAHTFAARPAADFFGIGAALALGGATGAQPRRVTLGAPTAVATLTVKMDGAGAVPPRNASVADAFVLAVAGVTGGAAAWTACIAYGAAIPVVSGYCGLSTFGGSEGVGWATTRAVVNTSLAIIIPTSIRSYVAHKARGGVDMTIIRAWAIPTVIGVIVGSALARFAPPVVFKLVFVFVAGLSASRLLGNFSWRLGDDLPRGPLMTLYGLVIGVLSALMGIGGGQLSSMFMTFYNRPIHQAVSTSAGMGVIISIPGAIGLMLAGWGREGLPPGSIGYVSLVGLVLFAPVSVWTAPLGVKLAHALPKRTLERAFGIFLLCVSLRFLSSIAGY